MLLQITCTLFLLFGCSLQPSRVRTAHADSVPWSARREKKYPKHNGAMKLLKRVGSASPPYPAHSDAAGKPFYVSKMPRNYESGVVDVAQPIHQHGRCAIKPRGAG